MNEKDIKKLQDAYALRGVEIHQLHERVTSLEAEIACLNLFLRRRLKTVFR